tara:strand:- start:590 stop:724 length:135 start_codon:yes stop_codon:yes gene_type:complete
MIITREHQIAMIENYQEKHTIMEAVAFSEGMEAMLELVTKGLKK